MKPQEKRHLEMTNTSKLYEMVDAIISLSCKNIIPHAVGTPALIYDLF